MTLISASFQRLSPEDKEMVRRGHHAHLRHSTLLCVLPQSFDLRADYADPKSHRVIVYNPYGAPNYHTARVWVDHEATGTGTTGTGDTVCCWTRPTTEV